MYISVKFRNYMAIVIMANVFMAKVFMAIVSEPVISLVWKG